MGLKQNVAYKALLTFSNYIFGFVTFPYVTRILGPSNFGLVNFAFNTVDYFLLFATLGITTIGTREIAAAKNNHEILNTTYTRILGLNVWLSAVILIIYILCIYLVPQFREAKELFWIGTAKILFSAFAVEWLFTGLENFKYITIRSIIIRSLYVVSVFIFVRTPSDYLLYFILTIGSVVVNSIVNFIYSKKFVSIVNRDFFSTCYVKQNFKLGIYTIMTSMYMTFNVMFLGLVSNNDQVAYYSTAVKMYFIAVNLFSAYTYVMLPRMTSLKSLSNEEQFSKYLSMSFNFVMLFAFPVIIFCMMQASQIIFLLSGPNYENAIFPMRILMPALFLVWLSQVMVLQGLLPLKLDNIPVKASILGGIVSLLINFTLTSDYGAVGSALTLVGCETAVTLYYVFIIHRNKYIKLPSLLKIGKYMIISIPFIGLSYIANLFNGVLISLFVGLSLYAVYFYIIIKTISKKAIY